MIRPSNRLDWVVQTPGIRFERLEAYFGGHAYEPHRHDTYAIGMTLSGIQSFHYRGTHQNSTPGDVLVLHPDERHDGHAGSDSGFQYRMMYVPPAIIQDILGGQPLPFVRGGLTRDPFLAGVVRRLLRYINSPRETFEDDDALYDLGQALCRCSHYEVSRRSLDYPAAQRARNYLEAAANQRISLADLEQVSGQNRWRLSRDFRALFGTSPYRYLVMRRLDDARHRIRNGVSIAEAAVTAGFADQSHLTRQFTDAFGVSPGRWSALANTTETLGR